MESYPLQATHPEKLEADSVDLPLATFWEDRSVNDKSGRVLGRKRGTQTAGTGPGPQELVGKQPHNLTYIHDTSTPPTKTTTTTTTRKQQQHQHVAFPLGFPLKTYIPSQKGHTHTHTHEPRSAVRKTWGRLMVSLGYQAARFDALVKPFLGLVVGASRF